MRAAAGQLYWTKSYRCSCGRSMVEGTHALTPVLHLSGSVSCLERRFQRSELHRVREQAEFWDELAETMTRDTRWVFEK
jgi:hypothetical protein